ncbi:MAG: 30S ribosomal protein S7 [Nitrospiraceae bacterium]|nr:30S ribosomal protein S7 [Nitrospiraceae bacterium]
MPRRREVHKRVILADPKYKNTLVSKFVNGLMHEGKKSLSQRIFYEAMDIVEKRSKEDPIKVFEQAMEHVKPVLEVRSRRVGGATYQVPVEVRSNRRQALAIRWLVNFSRKRGEKSMAQRLAGELLDAYHQRGMAFKKKEDTHRMAEANKAFAHYRW